MLTARNINYSVKNKAILNGVSVSFEPNQVSLILGANGAGKSTLIKVLSLQELHQKGSLNFEKTPLQVEGKQALVQRQAVLSQNTHVSFPLSVREIVMMGRYPHYKQQARPFDREVCEEAMRFLNIQSMEDRNFLSLSGGEQQRVHFARVLAQIWPDGQKQSKILYLDEPLTFLDIYYQKEFMELIRSFMQKQQMYVIGVLHDLNLAYQFADHITFLKGGELIASGKRDEVFNADNIKNCFGVDLKTAIGSKGESFFYV